MFGKKIELKLFSGGPEIGGPFCAGMKYENFSALLDCGLEAKQGGTRLPDFEAIRKWIDPKYVLISHQHLDHIAALPAMGSNGVSPIEIFMTPEARAFFPHQCNDTVRIGIREWCKEKNTTPQGLCAERGHIDWDFLCSKAKNLPYTFQDIRNVEYLINTVTPEKEFNLGDAVVKPFHAGHIMGAVSYLITVGGKRILFSGDISINDTRYDLIKKFDPTKIGPVDVFILNATYAGLNIEPWKNVSKRLGEDLPRDMQDGKQVIATSFFIDRGSKFALEVEKAGCLKYFKADGKTRDGIELYQPFTNKLDFINPDKHFISDKIDRARFIRTAIKNRKALCLLVSSGMGVEGSLSNSYIGENLTNPNCVIYKIGYAEPGTPVDLLERAYQGDRFVNWRGQEVEMKCEVRSYPASAHAPDHELAEAIRILRPGTTVFAHTEPARVDTLLKNNPGLPGKKIIAENGKTYKF